MLIILMEPKWIQVLQHWSYSWNRITAILEMQSTHRRNINLLDLWSRCYNILNPRHLFSISRSWRKSARWHGPIKPTSQACHWNYITVISTREQKNPTKNIKVLLTLFSCFVVCLWHGTVFSLVCNNKTKLHSTEHKYEYGCKCQLRKIRPQTKKRVKKVKRSNRNMEEFYYVFCRVELLFSVKAFSLFIKEICSSVCRLVL